MSVLTTEGQRFVNNCREAFKGGNIKAIPKTIGENPVAFTMDFNFAGKKRQRFRLHLFDPAGEVFDPLQGDDRYSSAIEKYKYYDFMKGVIVIIDPFSIPAVKKKYKNMGFASAQNDPTTDIEKFIRGLYAHDLDRTEYHYAYCAVVITKSDAFDLDSIIGHSATEKYMLKHGETNYTDAMNEVCSAKLREWEMGRLLDDLLELNLKEICCFSVSSLGHIPNGQPFEPRRVDLPIRWLLQKNGIKWIANETK